MAPSGEALMYMISNGRIHYDEKKMEKKVSEAQVIAHHSLI